MPVKSKIPDAIRKRIIELTHEGLSPAKIFDFFQMKIETQSITYEAIKKIVTRAKTSYSKAKTAEYELIETTKKAGLENALEGIEPIMRQLIRYKLERENYKYPEDPREILLLFRNIAEEEVLRYRNDPVLFGICNKVHQSILDMEMRITEFQNRNVGDENKFNINFNFNIIND
jgi:hypothetical protein